MWKNATSVYQFSSPGIQKVAGQNPGNLNLANYKGKVLLITNVASEWGLTKSNYEQFNTLYQKYHDKGLEIIAQPCNQFGKQEPLSGLPLWEHIVGKYNVKFDTFFARQDVNGSNASPLFLYLQNHKNCKGLLGINSLKWNFTKFLVDRNGEPMYRFGPKEAPLSFENKIQKLLDMEANSTSN